MRRTLWTALVVFLVDQLSKLYVLFVVFNLPYYSANLPEGARPYPPDVGVFPPYLTFKMAWNEGINFGLFGDMDLRWILVGIAVLVSIFVLYWVRKESPGRWAQIFAGFLVGGALGNAVDRVTYGAVADFLNMSCCGLYNPYAFNVADIAIFIGAVGLVFFGERSPGKRG